MNNDDKEKCIANPHVSAYYHTGICTGHESTVNTMLDGWARPIYLAGMLIGLIAGLVRNYDNIAAKNDNGNRMDGVIAVVWMVGYGLAGSVVINAIRTAAMGINRVSDMEYKVRKGLETPCRIGIFLSGIIGWYIPPV